MNVNYSCVILNASWSPRISNVETLVYIGYKPYNIRDNKPFISSVSYKCGLNSHIWNYVDGINHENIKIYVV